MILKDREAWAESGEHLCMPKGDASAIDQASIRLIQRRFRFDTSHNDTNVFKSKQSVLQLPEHLIDNTGY